MLMLQSGREPWQPPTPQTESIALDALPESLFANPLRRRGPLLNARYVDLVARGFDIIAETDEEQAIAYRRLIDAARYFHVAIDTRAIPERARVR